MFCPKCKKNDNDWNIEDALIIHNKCQYKAKNKEFLDYLRILGC
ncbi:MAG: hypothetical protein ACQESP_01585 [Candidatus Muiribacteriota bacterium]